MTLWSVNERPGDDAEGSSAEMPSLSADDKALGKGERIQPAEAECGAVHAIDSCLDGRAVRGREVAASVAAPGVNGMTGKRVKRLWLRVDEMLFRAASRAATQDMRPIWLELCWLLMLGLSARRRLFSKENNGKRRQVLSTAG